jgi:carbon monoxide dehydrogenase subunit G
VKIQGRHSFRAPRAVVWEALLDPQVLARTLPGCDELRAEGDHRFRGALNLRIGPVQGRFDGTVALTDLVASERFTISIRGQGPAGFLDGTGLVRLEDEEGGTALVYDMDARVGGRVAGVGQRLLDSTAKAVTSQALDGLGRQLEHLATAAGTAAAAAPPEAPGRVEFAAGVARGVAADLAGERPWGLIAGGVVLGLVLMLWWVFG